MSVSTIENCCLVKKKKNPLKRRVYSLKSDTSLGYLFLFYFIITIYNVLFNDFETIK